MKGTNLTNCAEPAEVMQEPIREGYVRQVILVPQLPAIRIRVYAAARGQLLNYIPHQGRRNAGCIPVIQMLRHAAEC
jgi:hypothetical protein